MWQDYLNTLPHYLLPKQLITSLAGLAATVKQPTIKNALIRQFIRHYDVNMAEALEEHPECYPDFNAFFTRLLKPGCRPIAAADVISPVDGYVSEIGRIQQGQLLQAKNKLYSVHELLGGEHIQSAAFEQGLFATLYLSPQDYHRIHMPLKATLKAMTYIPGKLFSVQPTTARTIPNLFARNERLVVLFDTQAGPMAMVLVGATIVGAIGTTWHGDLIRSRKPQHFTYNNAPSTQLAKAEEMGYFKLGSTVILLFADTTAVQWANPLRAGDKIQLGQALGQFTYNQR